MIEQRPPTMVAGLTSVPGDLKSALDNVVVCPAVTNLHLQHLASIPPRLAWYRAASVLVTSITTILDPRVPRHTQELFKQVWLRLNTVYPR